MFCRAKNFHCVGARGDWAVFVVQKWAGTKVTLSGALGALVPADARARPVSSPSLLCPRPLDSRLLAPKAAVVGHCRSRSQRVALALGNDARDYTYLLPPTPYRRSSYEYSYSYMVAYSCKRRKKHVMNSSRCFTNKCRRLR